MAAELFIGGLQVAKGFLDFANSYADSKALELQAESTRIRGEFESANHELNAGYADINAQNATDQGSRDAGKILGRGRQVAGSQRAGFAAQGIRVDSGSAGDIQDETKQLSDHDILTVKNNAWMASFGYKSEAAQERFASKMTTLKADSDANALEGKAKATLLGGGIAFLGAGMSAAKSFGEYSPGAAADNGGDYSSSQSKNLSKKNGWGSADVGRYKRILRG